jgi:DEAD/DEAH box helicase domain-containing protein
MIDFEEFINYIKTQDYYRGQISHIQHIPAEKAQFDKLQRPLNKRLERWLETNNIKLWSHQAAAINQVLNGNNTVIVTSTASGKSLCYNLCVL